MTDVAEPVQRLLGRFRDGDDAAAGELFRRYAVRLAHLADQHLAARFAGRLDGEDVVQSVFRTFFRRCARGEFAVDSSGRIWRLLVTLTLRKARGQARYHAAAKRDAGAELGGLPALADAVARDPGPAEAAEFVDAIDALLRGLPPDYGLILERRLQGDGVADIAARLGVSRQTVYRALELLQDRLRREFV